jgi:hypothetical protein
MNGREPDLGHLDDKLLTLLRRRTELLVQLDQLNREIDSVLLAQEHLKTAADNQPEAV